MVTIWKEVNRPLLIPRELMDEVEGNRARKVSVMVTKAIQVIVTRRPANHEIKYCVEIGKLDDFVPTVVLKVAKMDHMSEFKVKTHNGDLIVTGVGLSVGGNEKDILKPRILDI